METNNEDKKNIAIVGAGFAGIACAYDLAKAGFNVTIFEKDSDVGGLAGSFALKNGCYVEKFYHHLFDSDQAFLNFIKEVDLGSKIISYESKTGIFCDGKIFKLSAPIDLLLFKPLNFFARIKMGLGVLKARKISDFSALENTLATDWIKRNLGLSAYQKVWLPLLKGKFGECFDEISAVWITNKFKLRGGSRNNGGAEVLVYFKGGFKAILDSLKERLETMGVKFMLNSSVEKVEKIEDGFKVFSNNNEYTFNQVAFTTSPSRFLKTADFVPSAYRQKLESIKYLANICLVLVLNEQFQDMYWLNIADEKFPFVGIIEHTNFHSSKYYGGNKILYLSKYLNEENKLFSLSKDELIDYSLEFLQKINPKFSKNNILESYLFKAKDTQPVTVREYSKLLYDMKTGVDGLYFTSMSQIYPEDRGTNYAVEYGRKLASVIIKG